MSIAAKIDRVVRYGRGRLNLLTEAVLGKQFPILFAQGHDMNNAVVVRDIEAPTDSNRTRPESTGQS